MNSLVMTTWFPSRPRVAWSWKLARVTGRVLTAFLSLALSSSAAGDSAQSAPLTAEQKERLKERNRLRADAERLREAGKLPEAAATAEQALAITRKVFGEGHAEVASSLEFLAGIHEAREDFGAARKVRQEVLTIRKKLHGEDHWQITDVRLALEHVELLARLKPKQRAKVREAANCHNAGNKHLSVGRYAEAMPLYLQALQIRKEVLGDKHPEYARTLHNVALVYQNQREYAKAEPLFRQAGMIWKGAMGETYPLYALYLHNLGLLYQEQGAYAKAEPLYRQALHIRKEVLGEQHPAYAQSLNNLAVVYQEQGAYAKAEPLYRQALHIRKAVLGEKHFDYSQSLHNLAWFYQSQAEYAKAEPLYLQALHIRKAVVGEQHPAYAHSLHNLAWLYQSQGAYGKAEPLYLQALHIRKAVLGEKHPAFAHSLRNLAEVSLELKLYAKAELLFRQALQLRKETLGEKHPDYADSLNGLALVYLELGAYAKAEPLFRQALQLLKETQQEQHPTYADSLHNLAWFYQSQGEYTKAEPLYHQALQIRKAIQGEKHPFYARSLQNLAALYHEQGEFARAEPLHLQTLQIRKEVLGEKHPDYARSLQNLAAFYQNQGAYAKAEPFLRQALQIRKEALGENHPDYADNRHNLAVVYRFQAEYAKAEPLLRQALQIRKEVLGDKHPDYAHSLNHLAWLYEQQKEYVKAESLIRQANEITLEHLERSAEGQAEQAQFAHSKKMRYQLFHYLRNVEKAQTPTEEVYSLILSWKGAITARQRLARLARSALAGDPETVKLYQELESVSRQWANLSSSSPDPKKMPDLPARLRVLSERHERLEAELSRRTADFRRLRESRRLKPADLRKLLPEGTALLDFVETGACKEAHLVVFVVDSKQVRRIDLGASAPITDAVNRFRALVKRTRPVMGADDPSLVLREKLWQPIEKHLTGAKLVLLSPDGQLGQFPFALLPDRTGERYLLEKVSLAVVPVPRMLNELLDPVTAVKDEKALALLVGDVDFGAPPGKPGQVVASRSAARGTAESRKLEWRPLEGTRAEIDALRQAFLRHYPDRQPRVLLKGEATEEAVRREAPRCRWLHLATHGFFAPPHVRSALAYSHQDAKRFESFGLDRCGSAGHDPQLLSGLVLAGANRSADLGQDDGILTAREVAELDLSRVELAVLSACETGLGEVAGGEGVLGLQRAFQIAGARTSVTSLWQIPDEATRVLMERFYGNLWEKKMPKLAALREAQLWMLREGQAHPGIQRGMVFKDAPKPDAGGRLPPYYWAAFVLSGDWR